MNSVLQPEFGNVERESPLLIETKITATEMHTLTDSAFVYTGDDEFEATSETTALNAAMTRLQDFGHTEDEGSMYRLRCAVTAPELDAFGNAGAEVNPRSSQPILSQLHNAAEPAEALYRVELLIPMGYPEKLRETGIECLNILADYSSIDVIDTTDGPKVRANLATYLTQDEFDELSAITEDDVENELHSFCETIVEIAEEFDPLSERNTYIEEVSI